MSKSAPKKAAPANLALLFREPFRAGNELLHRRFAEGGHPDIRPPHGAVFPFLDEEGTRVSVLAERAEITKQAMAELIEHLERHGYVERIPDPTDRRAKLVRATDKGRELYVIAGDVLAEIEADWSRKLGKRKMAQLRQLLEELNEKL
jgi:DNA-binding MarR family transcriptional regulator